MFPPRREDSPPEWLTLITSLLSLPTPLLHIYVSAESLLTESGITEFFHPSPANYSSAIHLTIVASPPPGLMEHPTPLVLSFTEAEATLPDRAQLLLLGSAIASFILRSLQVQGRIVLDSEDKLAKQLRKKNFHLSGSCGRSVIPLHQLFQRHLRKAPPCHILTYIRKGVNRVPYGAHHLDPH